jgi:hypothetical protein
MRHTRPARVRAASSGHRRIASCPAAGMRLAAASHPERGRGSAPARLCYYRRAEETSDANTTTEPR